MDLFGVTGERTNIRVPPVGLTSRVSGKLAGYEHLSRTRALDAITRL